MPNTSMNSHLIVIISRKAKVSDLPFIHISKSRKTPLWLIIFNFCRKFTKKKLYLLWWRKTRRETSVFGTFALLIRNKMKCARERNELHSWRKWIHIWKSFEGKTTLWFCFWRKLNCVAKWNNFSQMKLSKIIIIHSKETAKDWKGGIRL